MMDIIKLSAIEIAEKIKLGDITAVDTAKAYIAQIKKVEKTINAYLYFNEEEVLQCAKETQQAIDTLKKEIENVSVSSTKIRKALENGNIEKANRYLGYAYLLTGKIVKGEGLGRKINFPTINLSIAESYKLIPKKGVYIVKSTINENTVFGVMNIGLRPTVSGKKQTIEILLLDFDQDLYGNKMQIKMLKRLRNEQKFDSVERLKEQIQKDEQKARLWLGKRY